MSEKSFPLPPPHYQNLQNAVFNDAGPHGMSMSLETQPSLDTGKAYHFGCLLTAERGKSFLRELASALAQKYPDDVVSE